MMVSDQTETETEHLISEFEPFNLKRDLKIDDSDEIQKIKKLKQIFSSTTPHTQPDKYLKLKQLELDLRNEEAKFLLLKRLYYSQRIASNTPQSVQTPQAARPTPLNKPAPKPNQQPSQLINNKTHNPPPQLSKPATPKPALTPQQLQQTNKNRLVNNQSPVTTASPSSAFSPIPTTATPDPVKKPNAQTQVLVNQLVRKEFEKSLSQVEFPHKQQQDIYFLPNANTPEFLMCLGLEEVVKCVQEHFNNKQQIKEFKEKQMNQDGDQQVAPTSFIQQVEVKYEYPLFCTQCCTDFTPVWRNDKAGVSLCEKCLKGIERKQVKQEHSARLKQLFTKASKDREVFEKQVLAEQATQKSQSTPVAKPAPVQQQNTQRNASPAVVNQPHAPKINQNQTPTINRVQQQQPVRTQQKSSQVIPVSRTTPTQQPNRQQPSGVKQIQKPDSNQHQQVSRQRTSTGGLLNNHNHHSNSSPSLLNNSKTNSGHSVSSTNVSNSNSGNQSSLAALAAQFPFSGLPTASAAALASLAQQQHQQQQQAALIQRFIQNQQQQQSNNFNLLAAAGLQSPATAAALSNYLNMSMFSSQANQNGKQWKNP